MVTTFTYKPSLVKIDAQNFKLSWKQTTFTYIPSLVKIDARNFELLW